MHWDAQKCTQSRIAEVLHGTDVYVEFVARRPRPVPRRPLAANGDVQGLSHQARRGHERHVQHLENKALYEVRICPDVLRGSRKRQGKGI